MLSYTQLRNRYGLFTNDKTSENLEFGVAEINTAIRQRLGENDWIFLEKNATATTVASQQGYQLPVDFAQMRTLTGSQGTTIWPVLEAPSRQFWDQLNIITYTSDIPQYYYVFDGQVLIYPTPSSSGNTLTFNYKKRVPNLNTADYTTGTISITQGDATVTGVGTTFTAAMVGLYLQTTDGFWYQIASFTDTTHLELVKNYAGSTISGATYTIGQLSPIPDAYEEMPALDAASTYYTRQGGFEKAKAMKELANGLAKKMKDEQGSKSTSPRITGDDAGSINPNLFIRY